MSVMWNEQRIELFDSRSSKKRKLFSIRRLWLCFAASEALDIADSGGDAVEGRLTGDYFDFAKVWLLLSHANRWSCSHEASIGAGTKRASERDFNRRVMQVKEELLGFGLYDPRPFDPAPHRTDTSDDKSPQVGGRFSAVQETRCALP